MNLLKQRREELRLTQRQVAERADICLRLYQKYENEERVPNVYAAIRIANALNTLPHKVFINNCNITHDCSQEKRGCKNERTNSKKSVSL